MKSGLFIFLIPVFSAFLVANIFSSQSISPFYQKVLEGDKMAVETFLESITSLPEFEQELTKYKLEFGDEIEKNVFSQSLQRKKDIENLENLLTKNSKARDVLYNLYLLYNQEGNLTRANEYFKRASKVDPSVTSEVTGFGTK